MYGRKIFASIIFLQDLGSKVCPKTGEVCSGRSAGTLCQGYRRVDSDPQWYRPTSLSELTALVTINSSSNIKLVAGDTGRGLRYAFIVNYARFNCCDTA